MGRVLSFSILSPALKASIIVWSFSLDFFSLSLPFPCFFEAKCVNTILFFVDTISRHARQNNFPSLAYSSSPGYCWIWSCILMFFASQFPLVLFFYWLMAEYALELSLPWLADFHCSLMTTWMTPSWNECDGLGFWKATADPSNLFPKPPWLLWLKWGQNVALDKINKVRLCFLAQNYTNHQSKIQNNASRIKCWDHKERA